MMVVPRHDIGYPLLAPSIHLTMPHGLELLAGRPTRTAGLYESFRQRLKTWLFSPAASVLGALETS